MSETMTPTEAIVPTAEPSNVMENEAVNPPEDETEGAEVEQADAPEDGVDAEPEEIEFKFGPETRKIPKGAVSEEFRAMLQEFANTAEASTTRKHQELAEMRKNVEARAESVLRMQKLSGELQDKFAEGMSIKRELAQLDQIDLNKVWQSNPDEARRISDYRNQQTARLQSIVGEVNAAEMQLTQTQSMETQRMNEHGKTMIEKKIPGFSKKANEVIDYAVKEFGVDRAEAEQYGLNPTAAIAMYKAMQFDRMMAAKSQKPKPATATPVAPQAKGGTATPTKDISKMSMDEYAAHMNKLDKAARTRKAS